jgi:two-component system, LuxR family, sensor histidine kinase DctS
MPRLDLRPPSLWGYWLSHRQIVSDAPPKAWGWFLASWLALSVAMCGGLLHMVIDRQHEHFVREAYYLTSMVENRLKSSELVLYGMEDIINSDPDINETELRRYADEAARRYRFIYTMGFEPRIAHYHRAAFESGRKAQFGQDFQILDFRHNGENGWQNPDGWHRAERRESYIPWVMAEPAPVESARRALGLDLQSDAVIGPTVRRALRSSEIEVSPSLSLGDGSTAIAYVHALYTTTPPSDSPIMRPDEATGVTFLLIRTDALVSLSPPQAALLDVALTRQEGASSEYDNTVFQSKASRPTGWLDDLLPRFELHEQIRTPYFPYEIRVASQFRLSMVTRRGLAAVVLFAILPSYLLMLIVAIRHNARKDREYADDSLYRTREHASVTLQAISDAVITIDNSRHVQYMNPAAQAHLGISEERAVGRPLSEVFKLRYEFARQAIADPFEECLQKRTALELEENSYLLRPNGEKLLIEGVASPLFDRDGSLIGGVLTFRDTAPLRRRMLEALETSETRLKQHENELARVSRLTLMGEMASGIAHEINQPLSAIMSYCQASLSLLEEDEPDLALICQAIQSAVTQADRAGKIVRRLREFVSKKQLQHTPVDVNHAVTNALTLAEYDLHSQGITVDYQPGTQLPLVYADTIQLEQVVLNLVRNALDAMQGQMEPPALQVETTFNARRVCIKVGDNGPGIPGDKIDNIFAPFFSTKTTGMGLGLTICQTIIESFGGEISAHNRSAGGAEFVVELPPLETALTQQLTETDS